MKCEIMFSKDSFQNEQENHNKENRFIYKTAKDTNNGNNIGDFIHFRLTVKNMNIDKTDLSL